MQDQPPISTILNKKRVSRKEDGSEGGLKVSRFKVCKLVLALTLDLRGETGWRKLGRLENLDSPSINGSSKLEGSPSEARG
jgi:hypothetical protein